jgi:hypothetical protein
MIILQCDYCGKEEKLNIEELTLQNIQNLGFYTYKLFFGGKKEITKTTVQHMCNICKKVTKE